MSARRFPGFPPRVVDEVSELLAARKIRFEVVDDKEEFARYEAAWKAAGGSIADRSQGQFDPHHIVFEIAEADVGRLEGDERLERLFWLQAVDEEAEARLLAHEDYLCPLCDHHQDTPGKCPTHGETLLTFADWNEARRQRGDGNRKSFAVMALGLVAIVALIIFLMR